VVSLVVIGLVVVLVGAAVLSRRGRKGARSVGAPLGRPVRLETENGTQRQHQQTQADVQLLVAHQSKREDEPAGQDDQAECNAEGHVVSSWGGGLSPVKSTEPSRR
jgi:hypothetical protein